MRHLIAATAIVLAIAALPAAAAAQGAGPAAETGVTATTPPPPLPWEAGRAPAEAAPRGPVLPGQVRPAVDRALGNDTPAPAAPDNIVIPVTTLTIVLAVVLLIVLID